MAQEYLYSKLSGAKFDVYNQFVIGLGLKFHFDTYVTGKTVRVPFEMFGDPTYFLVRGDTYEQAN